MKQNRIETFEQLLKENMMKYRNKLNLSGLASLSSLLEENTRVESNYEAFKKHLDSYLKGHAAASSTIINQLVNPYYLGMGNPESNLLIFGQELALSTDLSLEKNKRGIFEEQLLHQKLFLSPDKAFFDPHRPNNYRKIGKRGHTWGIYSSFVSSIKDKDSKNYSDYLVLPGNLPGNREQFFEDHCFFTELYDTPSPNHHTTSTSKERMQLFQSKNFREFFNKFEFVLIGCSSFFKDYQNNLKNYFGIETNSCKLIHFNYEKKKVQSFQEEKNSKPFIRAYLIKHNNQRIAVFNRQFSGPWPSAYIDGCINGLKSL